MEHVSEGVAIQNVGVLDLTGKKSSDLSGIAVIQNVGVILAPQALTDALMKIQQKNVGMTVTLPDTAAKTKILSGQLTLSGEVFANSTGSIDDILVITGQALITSPIEKIGYNEIIIAGQLLVPKQNEAALGAAITRMSGQIGYYHSEVPRLFLGEDKFSRAFFELIEHQMAIALVGSFEIEADVDASLLKQKISELIVMGELTAPKELVPMLQMLAVTKLGEISVKDDQAVPGGQ